MEAGSSTLLEHLLAAAVGLALPAVGAVQSLRWGETMERAGALGSRQKIAVYWSNGAVLAALGLAGVLVWLLAGRTLADLGLTLPPVRPGWGLALAGLFLLLYAADTRRELSPGRIETTKERWRRLTPFMPQTAREMRHSLALVAAASVGEEILYRGFLISYVGRFTGESPAGLAAAVGLPAAVFGICHFYQGGRAVLKILLLAGLFGAIFVMTRSLWIPILLHFIVDLAGVLLGPRLLGPAPSDVADAAIIRAQESPGGEA